MAKRIIRTGTTADPTGDSLKNAFTKVNDNFTELYNALGLDADTLNIGAFEFSGSTMTTTDSSAIVIDQAVTVSSDLTVGGDILPQTHLGGNLGSPTQQWKSLYVSTNTIYLNNVPLSLDGSNNLTVNGSIIGGSVDWADISSKPTLLTDSSSNTFTNKTINIAFGEGNTFQIQGNSITSYSGSGSVIALTSMPTFYGMNVRDSGLTVDGGTGSYYWSGPTGVAVAGIDKAGVYRSGPSATNSLFTFGANGSGTMSAAVEGSLFVGTARPSNNGGLTTDYSGWLVVQSGGKFGGDINTLGGLHFDDATTGYVYFANSATLTPSSNDLTLTTNTGGSKKIWTFGNDGSTTFPSGAGFGLGDNNQLKVNDATTNSLDFRDSSGRGYYTNNDGFTLRSNGSYSWLFKTDSQLHLPGAIRLKVYADSTARDSAITSPTAGLMILVGTATQVYDGSAWRTLSYSA